MTNREAYFAALENVPEAVLHFLLDFEGIRNDFQPRRLGEYAAYLREHHVEPLAEQAALLQERSVPEGIEGFHTMLSRGVEHTANTARLFAEFAESSDIGKALKSWRELGEAYRHLYPLRAVVPGMRRYWVLPEAFEEVDRYDPPLDTESADALGASLLGPADNHHWYARYVPEWYTPDHAWPVVITLHGGWGRGDTFLWSWVRAAKTRGFIVLSPKSYGTTWSEGDLLGLLAIVEETAQQFTVDRSRVLLTGMSDGGIYSYLYGLNHQESFAALAVISANFMPFMLPDGAAPLPIYIMHGEADHMFDVQIARGAAWYLQEHGCPVEYHERAGYGHYYPPAENLRILDWFERLTGPGPRPPAATT